MSPVVVGILAALATGLFLLLALAIESWAWSGLVHYPDDKISNVPRQPRKYPEIIVRGVVVIAGAYILYYLIWRLSTLTPQAMWLSWLLWAAEAYGFLVFLLFAFMAWRLVQPKTPTPQHDISVDVFVPTRGEPIDILRATLIGCNHIRYPHQTFVLDDSARAEVQTLAAQLGCNYISRTTHEGAKAGNLNYALRRTRSELVAILDADHIPLPEFLHNTIGFFNDQTVAVVQGPQLFYNLDSFQHERSAWHEQRLFYQVIMPGKNRTNSAFWCGSPSVLRRSAIEKVGGIAQETVTEDLHTTMRLVRHGCHVVYTEQPLAVGLSPTSIEDYLGQRFRWGQGAMQVLRSKDSPLWAPGLTLAQRLSFIASTTTYFDGLQVIILLAVPIVTLLTGLLPVSAFTLPFVARLIPYLILIFLANTLLGRGTYNLWHIERYTMLRAFTFASVIPTLFTGRARPFRVTRKDTGGSVRSASLSLVIPHIITIALCLIAIAVAALHLIHPVWYEQQSVPLTIGIVWVLINMTLLSMGVARLLSVSRRSRYRFPIVADLRWRVTGDTLWQSGHSLDLSARGISFEHSGPPLRVGDNIELSILLRIPHSELPSSTDSTAPAIRESEILFAGHVAANHPVQLRGTQQLGVVIDKFVSDTCANSYAYLLHQPAHLLHGEKISQCPRN